MIKIKEIKKFKYESWTSIDSYTPISFTTYEGTIGARYLRLGNFKTSLLEFSLDPDLGLIRGFTLVLFADVHEPEFIEKAEDQGLPIIESPQATSFQGSRYALRSDLSTRLSFGLGEDFAEILFSPIKKADKATLCGRVSFLSHEHSLIGVRISNLTCAERDILTVFKNEVETRAIEAPLSA